jgi:hypothetical protein
MSLLGGGNVGIGTTSPTSRLHVNGSLAAATGNEVAARIDYTVNKSSSGNDTGLLISMTDTASPGTSLLIDAQVGGASKFSVSNTGALKVAAYERHVQVPINASVISGTTTCTYGAGTAVAAGTLVNQNVDHLYLQWEVPTDWDGTTAPVFEVDYVNNGAALTAGQTVIWIAHYRSVAQGEDLDVSHSATIGTVTATYTDAGAGTPQGTVIHTPITLNDTANQTITKGDHVFIHVIRDATSDTYNSDVCATAFEVLYQSTGIPMSN